MYRTGFRVMCDTHKPESRIVERQTSRLLNFGDRKMAKTSSPKTGKANNMAKSAASAKPMAKDTSKAVVAFVDPKALAPKGEGEKVVKALCSSAAQIDELEQKLSTAKLNKGAALSAMTQLFIVAGKADKQINFAVVNSEDKKAKEKLFDRLRAVLGIIDVRINPDGTEVRTQSAWADEMFPRIGETAKNTKEGDTFVGRETNRANFSARIREAAKGAFGVLSNGITSEIDKASGKLAISGKAVREHFNQDRVLLDERQNFEADGKTVNLKAKPSITELGRMGGAVVRQRGGAAPSSVNVSNPDAVAERIASWQKIVESLGKVAGRLDDKILSALDNLVEAIEKAQEENATKAAA